MAWRCRFALPAAGRGAFLAEERGAILALTAFVLMAAVGFAALAVDMSYSYAMRTRLQAAADAAALAGASRLPSQSVALAAAVEYAQKNLPAAQFGSVLADADVIFGRWDFATRTFTAGSTPANAVQVTTRRSAENGNASPLFFAQVLGFEDTSIAVRSTAATLSPGGIGAPICLLILDPTGGSVLAQNGNARINAEGCHIQVNSNHPNALAHNGNPRLTAAETCVVGGYSGSGFTPPPTTNCAEVEDPLDSLAPPSSAGCNYTNFSHSGGTVVVHPGVYCGGLRISGNGTVTFASGVYVIKGGPFEISGSSDTQGSAVTFYLTDGAVLDMSGGGSHQYSAPPSGPMAGIVFFQDRNETPGLEHRMTGSFVEGVEGIAYLPVGDLRITGNASLAAISDFSSFIVRRLRNSGNSSITLGSDYRASGLPIPCAITQACLRLVN